jgi:hypothetical protein
VNPIGRRTRRADDWSSPHERARTRAAQRLDWPLDPAEAAWLEAHLAECRPCRRRAAEYLENRDRLRTLRDSAPPPPRDLWARTAAAIELESQHGRRAPVRGLPVGALSGIVVIVVVLGATLLSNTPVPTITRPTESAPVTAASAAASLLPGPAGTPFVVAAGDVGIFQRDPDGHFGYGLLGVDSVCPKEQNVDCPMVPDPSAMAMALNAEPQTIIGSPDDEQAIVVSKPDASNANEVRVFVLPKASEAPESVAPETEPPASEEPTATADVSEPPAASEPPTTASAAPETPPASEPPTESPTPITPLSSTEPSDEPATATPEPTDTTTPTPTPESVAIASGLNVVGQTAAYSPDGTWFAFTARPADESSGPDIYVWRVGSERAEAVTNDHRSVFASWASDQLVGSRPAAALPDGQEVDAETFLLDPESGTETALDMNGWQPVVAPGGDRALVFEGQVAATDDGNGIAPGEGTLELRAWNADTGTAAGNGETVLDASGTAFDARWDESGTAFAVWVQDPADPSFGRLSLYFIDSDGDLVQPDNAPQEEPALPGFSIGEGRLAWATPSGQGGEGSRVQIVAWTDDGVGTAETAPGDQVVVIR